MKQPSFLKKKNFKFGTVATAITVGFIALVVIVNVIATLLLQKFPLTIDLTSSGKYEISQESIDYLGTVDRDVGIYIMGDSANFSDPASPYAYQVGEILRKYPQYSDRISLNYINLETNPGFAASYPDLTFSGGDVLIQSDLRYQKFAWNDLFNIGYDTNYNVTSVSSVAEEVVTGSLIYVTDDAPTSVIFTSGHGETTADGLVNVLQKNGFVTSTLSTLGSEIDPEASFVVVAAPTIDFTQEEIAKLDSFLNNGGDYGKQLIYAANPDQPAMPNLEAFLAEWGLSFESGVLVETDPNRMYNTFFWSIQDDASIDLTFIGREEPLKAPIVMRNVRPITPLFDAQNLRSTTVLCSTYDSATLYPLDAPDDWDIGSQPTRAFDTIVAAQKETDAQIGKTPARSTIVAFGSSDMLASGVADSASFGNSQFTVSLLNKLSGKEDKSITIASKDMMAVSLDINATTAIVLGIIFVAVLPLIVFVIGLVVYLRRRNL